jgi:hypothetical protein
VQEALKYVQAQEATAAGLARQPDDIEATLREDRRLVETVPDNQRQSWFEARRAASTAVDDADARQKTVTDEELDAARQRVKLLEDERREATGDTLLAATIELLDAEAKLADLEDVRNGATADRADHRVDRWKYDEFYRQRLAAMVLLVDRDTAVNQAADAVEHAELRYRQAQRDERVYVAVQGMPFVGDSVDRDWGLWWAFGRVVAAGVDALDHTFGTR